MVPIFATLVNSMKTPLFATAKLILFTQINEQWKPLRSPYGTCLLMVIISAAIGLVFGSAVGALAGSLLYQGEGDFFLSMQNFNDESLGVPLMTMQGITSLFRFLHFPIFCRGHLSGKKDLVISAISGLSFLSFAFDSWD